MDQSQQRSARDFHHPYGDGAYSIQVQLMNAVYGCLEEGRVGVFESPTGEFVSAFALVLDW